jgi:hypothetical protein
MSRRITRRAAARILFAGPAVLAYHRILRAEPAPAKPRLSAAQRREMDKSVAQLRSTAEKIRKVPLPMGSEPAFVFQPILHRK